MRLLRVLAVPLLLAGPMFAAEPATPPPTLRAALLAQLRSTHSQSGWFVCANVAVANLTPQQASWTDGKGNHSVGQLANHLVFWNSRTLAHLRGEPEPKWTGSNDETFNDFDAARWTETTARLDRVMTDYETLVAQAPEAKLAEWAPTLANVAMHNAYHIGQIVFVRKEQGVWDATKGVK